MFKQNLYRKSKHILCSVTFFRKPCPFWVHVEKRGKAIQATDDNVAHPHWMLDKQSYRQTLRIYNIYCFLRQ